MQTFQQDDYCLLLLIEFFKKCLWGFSYSTFVLFYCIFVLNAFIVSLPEQNFGPGEGGVKIKIHKVNNETFPS